MRCARSNAAAMRSPTPASSRPPTSSSSSARSPTAPPGNGPGLERAFVSIDTPVVLFTDVVGAAMRWEADAAGMAQALAVHDATMVAAVEANRGRLLKSKGEGDSTVSVFTDATSALLGA